MLAAGDELWRDNHIRLTAGSKFVEIVVVLRLLSDLTVDGPNVDRATCSVRDKVGCSSKTGSFQIVLVANEGLGCIHRVVLRRMGAGANPWLSRTETSFQEDRLTEMSVMTGWAWGMGHIGRTYGSCVGVGKLLGLGKNWVIRSFALGRCGMLRYVGGTCPGGQRGFIL